MYKKKTICVIVPAYNEELLIGSVIEKMPDFVDRIIIVNDKSTDKTREKVEKYMQESNKVLLVNHDENIGNGGSLITGYVKSKELNMDVVVVMDGDAQMDPEDLPAVIDPVIEGKADYTKGNRLFHEDVRSIMPGYRFVGNSALTLLTKFATGYWRLVDPQFSYTAISRDALLAIPIKKMIKGYGYNADILNMLNLVNKKVVDVDTRPVYGVGEKSNIKVVRYTFKVSGILTKLFLKRMVHKYVLREFHPLIFFYLFSFFNFIIIGIPFTIRFFYMYGTTGEAPRTTLIILVFALMMGFFSFFFGMWMDMEDNKKLIGE